MSELERLKRENQMLRKECDELSNALDTMRQAAIKRLGCSVCKMNETPFLSTNHAPLDFSRTYS